MYIVVGLGNPGTEYAHTRHNVGRMMEDYIEDSGKIKAKFLYLPTFMNKSGVGVAKFVKSKKEAEKLVVIYDDLDLPLGSLKISYSRSSGGHRGVESIIRALKTENFIRLRIGIAPATSGGKIRKPKGEKAVLDFILGKFRATEEATLKKVFKTALDAVETIVSEGKDVAMNKFN
ncbi:MAG: aminoacyl-tRNA hydrolase [Patescibacteria group bacterium]